MREQVISVSHAQRRHGNFTGSVDVQIRWRTPVWPVRRCLPQQHEENRKVRTLVHTALDPALHMLTPHNVRFRDKFHAVDEAKKPVKESFSTAE